MAVGGAIEAAASIGTTAARSVKEILIGVVEGLREVAGAAFPAGPARGSSAREATPPKKTTG